MNTNNLITNNALAVIDADFCDEVTARNNKAQRTLLIRLASKLPRREFNDEWIGMGGSLTGMVDEDLDVQDGFHSRDADGRVLIVLPGAMGNVIYFDRYKEDTTRPVIAAGYLTDVAPNWGVTTKPVANSFAVNSSHLAGAMSKKMKSIEAMDRLKKAD